MRLQALGDQDAVVVVELDHVGHGAQRHQIEQLGQVGLGRAPSKAPRSAQLGAQREHHVEHHADAGQGCLARESRSRAGWGSTITSASGSVVDRAGGGR